MEVTIVGNGFRPGKKANTRIAELLGVEPGVNYCNDLAAAAECIEFEQRVPYLKPTTSGGHVTVFDHGGAVCVTQECKKASHAFACALLYILEEKAASEGPTLS